jgi:hypothetical protein
MAFLERWLPRWKRPQPVKPAAAEAAPLAAPQELSRRDFLRKAGAAFVGATVGAGMGHEILKAGTAVQAEGEAQADSASTVDEAGHGAASHEAASEHEAEPTEAFEALNRQTALPVATAFAAYIADGAFFGGSFGPKSAAILNTLEAMRLATLHSQGGERGQHTAAHEFRENAKAATLAIPLVAISDFTTTAVHLDHETLFAKAKELVESDDVVEDRPALEASREDWEAYLEHLNHRIVENVTEVQAITSILAPFITTYTSSAIADQLKETVLRNTYEQSYARAVVESKRAGTETTHEFAQSAAIERANELFNGKWGFTNLETTLAANIQGGVLAGDPPQLFGAAAHWGEWGRLAKAEAFGLVNDAAMTYGLTATWLQRAEALTGGQKELAEQFTAAYQQATKVFGGITFGSPDKRTMAALREAGIGLGQSEVVKLAEAQKLLHLSVGDYARRKASWMEKFTTQNAGVDLVGFVGSLARSAGDVARSGLNRFERFSAGLSSGNGRGFGLGNQVEPDGGEIGGVYRTMINNVAEHTVQLESLAGPEPEPEFVHQFQEQLAAAIAEGKKVVARGQASEQLAVKLENLAAHQPQQLEQVFEQAAPTAAGATTQAESGTNKNAPGHATEPHHGFLSHAGQEVLWALSSQMPAVEPTAVLAEQAISKTFQLRGGAERSNKERVLGAAGAAYASEAVLSSLADNIAAYLYAEKLLGNIVTKVYGADVMEKYPGVGDVVYATAIKMAEQAGALTKLGNGPNFSQRKLELRPSAGGERGAGADFEVVAGELPFELYTNRYAVAANLLLMGGSLAWLNHELSKIEAPTD